MGSSCSPMRNFDSSKTHTLTLYFLDSGSYSRGWLDIFGFFNPTEYDYLRTSQIDWFLQESGKPKPHSGVLQTRLTHFLHSFHPRDCTAFPPRRWERPRPCMGTPGPNHTHDTQTREAQRPHVLPYAIVRLTTLSSKPICILILLLL